MLDADVPLSVLVEPGRFLTLSRDASRAAEGDPRVVAHRRVALGRVHDAAPPSRRLPRRALRAARARHRHHGAGRADRARRARPQVPRARTRRHDRAAAHAADVGVGAARRSLRVRSAQGGGRDRRHPGPCPRSALRRHRVRPAPPSRRRAVRIRARAATVGHGAGQRSPWRRRPRRSCAGAKLRTGAVVERIDVADDAVRGVVLEGGERIDAQTVLSTVDPRARCSSGSIRSGSIPSSCARSGTCATAGAPRSCCTHSPRSPRSRAWHPGHWRESCR